MKYRAIALFLLACFFPSLACYLPTVPDPAVKDAVESTLAAQQVQTMQVAQPTRPVVALTSLPTPSSIPSTAVAFPTTSPNQDSELVGGVFRYYARPGDTPEAVELRFGIEPGTLLNPQEHPPRMMLAPGTAFEIPNTLGELEILPRLFPDSEVLYSPALRGFSTADAVRSAGGYLSSYSELVDGETMDGVQIVERVALETSINPRLLLAFLEYRSGWLKGQPADPMQVQFPIGFYAGDYHGLYSELILTARQLTIGYYGWRSGKTIMLDFVGGTRQRIDPLENPGSVALQYLFSKLYNQGNWKSELYDPGQFIHFYETMYPDLWARAAQVDPMLSYGLVQPVLELPFQPGETWTLTGGPHAAWGVGSPWGGLDFAPAAVEKGCTVSRFWATAAASGLVTRSERGVVAVDLDGDGFEGSGWVLIYMHIASSERVPVGTFVQLDERIGHPSCEGGKSTGTHLHLSRKYNGEWMSAGGPVPFILSGWQAWPGDKQYSGSLTRGDAVVTARPDDAYSSLITR